MLGMFLPFSPGFHSILVKLISLLYPPGRSSFTLRKFVQHSTRKRLHTQQIHNPCFLFPVQLPLGFLTIAGQCGVSGVPESWLPGHLFSYSKSSGGGAEESLPLRFCRQGQPWDRAWGPNLVRESQNLVQNEPRCYFSGKLPKSCVKSHKRISEGMEKPRLRVLVHAKLTTV